MISGKIFKFIFYGLLGFLVYGNSFDLSILNGRHEIHISTVLSDNEEVNISSSYEVSMSANTLSISELGINIPLPNSNFPQIKLPKNINFILQGQNFNIQLSLENDFFIIKYLDGSIYEGSQFDINIHKLEEQNFLADNRYEATSWHPLSPGDVDNAICAYKAPTLKSMNKYLVSIDYPKSEEIRFYHGDDDLLINHIRVSSEMATVIKDIFATKRYGEMEIDLSNFTKVKKCSDALCVFKTVFGKKKGVKIAYIRAKYGINTSYLGFEKTSPWSDNNLNTIISSIMMLPKRILPIKDNLQLVHFKYKEIYNDDFENPVANAKIYIFDSWDELSKEEQIETIYHEIAHNISIKLNHFDSTEEWFKAGTWHFDEEGFPYQEILNSISIYGQTDPGEDFAETMVAYRFIPKKLFEINPVKFNLIKNGIFDGLEYRESNLCNK